MRSIFFLGLFSLFIFNVSYAVDPISCEQELKNAQTKNKILYSLSIAKGAAAYPLWDCKSKRISVETVEKFVRDAFNTWRDLDPFDISTLASLQKFMSQARFALRTFERVCPTDLSDPAPALIEESLQPFIRDMETLYRLANERLSDMRIINLSRALTNIPNLLLNGPGHLFPVGHRCNNTEPGELPYDEIQVLNCAGEDYYKRKIQVLISANPADSNVPLGSYVFPGSSIEVPASFAVRINGANISELTKKVTLIFEKQHFSAGLPGFGGSGTRPTTNIHEMTHFNIRTNSKPRFHANFAYSQHTRKLEKTSNELLFFLPRTVQEELRLPNLRVNNLICSLE